MQESRKPRSEKIKSSELKKVPEKGIEPEVTEEEKVREESRKFREIEEEKKRLKELEREESRERFRAIEEEEKRLKELERERILKEEKELEEKEKKKSIFEAIKEFIGIPEEELIKWDDLILYDSEKARQAIEEEVKGGLKEAIALVAGIESEENRKFLTKFLIDEKTGKVAKGKKQRYWKVISVGLAFNRTKWAQEMRDKIYWDEEARIGWGEEPGKKGRVRGGINMKLVDWVVGRLLGGLHKTEWWFNLRKVIDKVYPKGFYTPPDLLASTSGLSVEEKEKIKWWERVAKSSPADAILSFLGDSSREAQEMVEKYYGGDKRLEWANQRYLESIYEKSL